VTPLPTLGYVYHPQSFAPLSVVEAAEGVCTLLWIVDGSNPEAAHVSKLLQKFGPVVDSSAHDFSDLVDTVRSYAPDGILSMHDGDLVWTAHLAQELQLPFHSPDTAEKLTDKHAQRQALAAAALVVPAYRILPRGADAGKVRDLASDFPYPAVLKPRWGQMSRDTLPVASFAHLDEILGDRGLESEDYVLEGYIPDTERELAGTGFANFVSVETVVETGQIHHATISARTPFRWPFRETGYFTPSALSDDLAVEVYRVALGAAAALGVQTGCLHTEIKLTNEGPVVIEVNGRPGGGMSEMLERASGFSILRCALSLAVGASVGLSGPVPCSRIGYLLYVFPEFDVEWIDAVEGLPELRAVDGVDEIVLVRGPGQRIDWREGSEAHVFHLTGTTRDLDELRRLIATTTQLVRIEGHNGAG
jgi:hypothetical protein